MPGATETVRVCSRRPVLLVLCAATFSSACASAAPPVRRGTMADAKAVTWQYSVSFEQPADRRGRPRNPGRAFLWLPPASERLRGLFVLGRILIEGELAIDPRVREACAAEDIGIVYFTPHISGVFHYWEDGNTDAARLLKALDDLAALSGRRDLRRVPWITAGHSTGGIFCRNVAYWKPKRVAGIVHIKSGNFHQAVHIPPAGGLQGIPLVAINGHLETFGPEGGVREEFGRETQWVFVLRDIQRFRRRDPAHLMSLAVHPGADHFHGSPELAAYVATFIRKTAAYRLPRELPPGDGPVECVAVRLEDGWLTDPDLKRPTFAPAPYADYAGDRASAPWHYDREMAEATCRFHDKLTAHQVLDSPSCEWLDEGDGWTFRASSKFLDVMPSKFGGSVGGKRVGHSGTPFIFRCKADEPVARVGPDTFRLLRHVKRVHISAFHPGDDRYRSTIRWSRIEPPRPKGAREQDIDFPPVPDVRAKAGPVELSAEATSGLPVHYEVDYGPVIVVDGRIELSDVPRGARLPIECSLTAHQIGRRVAPAVRPAGPVTRVFRIVD